MPNSTMIKTIIKVSKRTYQTKTCLHWVVNYKCPNLKIAVVFHVKIS